MPAQLACRAHFRAPVALARGSKKKGVTQAVESAIKRNLLRKPLVFSTHARSRMERRLIAEEDIKLLLREGAINKEHSKFGGLPSPVYAVEGSIRGRVLRIVCASNENATVVVTVVADEGV